MAEDTSGASFATKAAPAVNLATGNLLVVGCRAGTGVAITVTDTAANTFTSATSITSVPIGVMQLFYAKNTTANATDVATCNYTPNTTYTSAVAAQYSGASTTAPLDQVATGISGPGVTSVTTGSFTTTTANEIIGCFGTTNNVANTFVANSGAGYTLRTTNPSMAAYEDVTVTAIQTGVTSTMSDGSQDWLMVCGTFK